MEAEPLTLGLPRSLGDRFGVAFAALLRTHFSWGVEWRSDRLAVSAPPTDSPADYGQS